MDPWFYWLVAGVLLILLELVFSGFVLICFSFATIATSLISLLKIGLNLQILCFIILTLVSFIALRPFFLKHMKPRGGLVETNVYALIGRQGTVLEEINPMKNLGRIKIRGEEWSALSQDGHVIPVDSIVKIIEISGNKVIVQLHSKGE